MRFMPRNALAVGAALALLSTSWMLGCDASSGREVSFTMELRGATRTGDDPHHFITASGWDVTLSQATIVLGPVYLYENAPPAAALQPWWHPDRWLLSAAHAHAGDQHFSGGRVLGEWVDQQAFDCLGAPVALGPFTGTEATARSFSIRLDPPRSPLRAQSDPTHGYHAWLAGSAAKDGMTIRFEGGLEIGSEGTLRRVDGLSTQALLAEGGRFTLTVHPDAWLDLARFDALEPASNPDAPRVIGPTSQPHAVWFLGVRGGAGYTGTWSVPAGR